MHGRLKTVLDLGAGLVFAAEATARAVRKATTSKPLPRGATLRPGHDTPLWNELSAALRSVNWTYGEKANLGRYLGVPRQRVDDFIMGRRRMPDAERTLMLVHWLAARRRGVRVL